MKDKKKKTKKKKKGEKNLNSIIKLIDPMVEVALVSCEKKVESVLMAREQLLVLMYKDVQFSNDMNSSLPCEVVFLL